MDGPTIRPPPAFCDPDDPGCDGSECGGDDDDVELNANGRLKSTCERCSQAKVKCSGSIPCERCTRKGFECEYRMEKKRGRRTALKVKKELCSDASCWGQIVLNPVNKIENFGARFGLESVERRIFQVFFAMYKHHATPQSCCKGWFSYQLNKMSTFMLRNGNKEGSEKLDGWMSRKGIKLMRREVADYRKIPANVIDEVSGMVLPPIHPLKGPKLTVVESEHQSKRKRTNRAGSKTYSTRGYYDSEGPPSPVDHEIDNMRQNMCYLNLRATHERFEVEVNDKFVALFGYTTRDIILVLERLFGGLLPWGCDVLALLLSSDRDLLFFMRTLALKMNHLGRPPQFPATRQACSFHVFDFDTKNGDTVECLLKCVHREYLSMDRTEVDIYMGFEPMMPNVPRVFSTEGVAQRMTSIPGEDSSSYMETKTGYGTEHDYSRSPSAASGLSSEESHSHHSNTAQPGSLMVPTENSYARELGNRRMAHQELHTQVAQMGLADSKRPPPQRAPQFQMPPNRPVLAGTAESEPPENELEGNVFLDNIMNWVDSNDDNAEQEDGNGDDFLPGNLSLGGASAFIPGTNSVMSQLSFSSMNGQGDDFDYPDASVIAMAQQRQQQLMQQQQQRHQQQPPKQACALEMLPPQPGEGRRDNRR